MARSNVPVPPCARFGSSAPPLRPRGAWACRLLDAWGGLGWPGVLRGSRLRGRDLPATACNCLRRPESHLRSLSPGRVGALRWPAAGHDGLLWWPGRACYGAHSPGLPRGGPSRGATGRKGAPNATLSDDDDGRPGSIRGPLGQLQQEGRLMMVVCLSQSAACRPLQCLGG